MSDLSRSALLMPMKENKPSKTCCKSPMEIIFQNRKNSINEGINSGYSKYLFEDMKDIEEHHVSKELDFTVKFQNLEEMGKINESIEENSPEMTFSHQKKKKSI